LDQGLYRIEKELNISPWNYTKRKMIVDIDGKMTGETKP
jgi:hypothetical protein